MAILKRKRGCFKKQLRFLKKAQQREMAGVGAGENVPSCQLLYGSVAVRLLVSKRAAFGL